MSAAVELPDGLKQAVCVMVAINESHGGMPPVEAVELILAIIPAAREELVAKTVELAKRHDIVPGCFEPDEQCKDAICAYFVEMHKDLLAFLASPEAQQLDVGDEDVVLH